MHEIINLSKMKTCTRCNGKGCDICNDGIYQDENFIIVTEDINGQKIAFNSEYYGK